MKDIGLIGITGGIGSGKSVVSRVLATMGYPVYDCDSRAKALMNDSLEIRQELTEVFGQDLYKSDYLDREKLGSLIFNSPVKLKLVNAIVHPVVKQDLMDWYSRKKCLCFVESAILYESGFVSMVDNVVRVVAPDELRVRRVMQRSGLSEDEVVSRMANQTAVCKNGIGECVVVNDDQEPVLPQLMAFLQNLR